MFSSALNFQSKPPIPPPRDLISQPMSKKSIRFDIHHEKDFNLIFYGFLKYFLEMKGALFFFCPILR